MDLNKPWEANLPIKQDKPDVHAVKAMEYLKLARTHFRLAGSKMALAAVIRAIKSADGAVRHAKAKRGN